MADVSARTDRKFQAVASVLDCKKKSLIGALELVGQEVYCPSFAAPFQTLFMGSLPNFMNLRNVPSGRPS